MYYGVIRQASNGTLKFEAFTTINGAVQAVQEHGGYIVKLVRLEEVSNDC